MKKELKIINLFNKLNYKNLYEVSPDKFFCGTKLKNRCIANSKQKSILLRKSAPIYICGSKFITDEIIDIIKNR